MTKKPTTEERFQAWLADFRAGRPCLGFLLALETSTDDQLRPHWKDADRRHKKYLRDKEYIKRARAAHAAAWDEKKE